MDAAELDLVGRARAGDADAFGGIVQLYSRTLWRAAWRVLGDGEAAEDAVQEAFLHAWRALDRFDDRSELSTWLYRIAVNAALDRWRQNRRRPAPAPLPQAPDGELLTATAEPSPLRRAASAEVARRTRRALVGLPAAERTAFLLRHFEGRSIAEIAAALGTRESAAKQAVFRAVRKLRSILAPLMEASHVESI